MGKRSKEVIREAPLNNNCPECYNQDMTLRFYQDHLDSRFYHRVLSGVSRELQCNTCSSIIYPVSWTEDIERSVDYYEKLVQPEPAALRLKPLFFIVVLLAVVLIAAGVYLYLEGYFTA